MSESNKEINNKEINNKTEDNSRSKRVAEFLEIIKKDPDLAASLWYEVMENSLRDPLTGLYNKRYMDERLSEEIERRRRKIRNGEEFEPLTLLIFDLDNLKAVNDGKKVLGEEGSKNSGHSAGDKYLKIMAESIEGNMRSSDIPIRFGGDEFAAILLDTEPERGAETVIDRIRGKFEELKEEKGLPKYTGFSVGVAEWQKEDTFESLFNRADKNMYLEKKEKRREKNEEK